MAFQRELEALEILRNELRSFYLDRGFVGFRVNLTNGELTVYVIYDADIVEEQLLSDTKRNTVESDVRSVNFSSISAVVSNVIIRAEKPADAETASSGDRAWGDGLGGFGTLGWVVLLDGVLIGISNWHVFCANGNSTPVGTDCFANFEQIGQLAYFDRVDFGINYWDFAYCSIRLGTVTDQLRTCAGGQQYPYPRRFGFPGPNRNYYKVGARDPICRIGRYLYVGSTRVHYDSNLIATFDNQIFFSKMSDRGDSGCIIVDVQSNEVVGLNFAGNDEHSIANPIALKGWTAKGVRYFSGVEYPEFESGMASAIVSSPDIRISKTISATPTDFPDLSSSSLPPELKTAGNSFRILRLPELNFDARSNMRGGVNATILGVSGDWLRVRIIYEITLNERGDRRPEIVEGWVHAASGTLFLPWRGY